MPLSSAGANCACSGRVIECIQHGLHGPPCRQGQEAALQEDSMFDCDVHHLQRIMKISPQDLGPCRNRCSFTLCVTCLDTGATCYTQLPLLVCTGRGCLSPGCPATAAVRLGVGCLLPIFLRYIVNVAALTLDCCTIKCLCVEYR
jgi:hypothetical protein